MKISLSVPVLTLVLTTLLSESLVAACSIQNDASNLGRTDYAPGEWQKFLCKGTDACAYATIDGCDEVICTGKNACKGAEIILRAGGSLLCDKGYTDKDEALVNPVCASATVSVSSNGYAGTHTSAGSTNVECIGESSCLSATIGGCDEVLCKGPSACKDSQIRVRGGGSVTCETENNSGICSTATISVADDGYGSNNGYHGSDSMIHVTCTGHRMEYACPVFGPNGAVVCGPPPSARTCGRNPCARATIHGDIVSSTSPCDPPTAAPTPCPWWLIWWPGC